MERWVLTFVLGLVGGVAGAVGVGLVKDSGGPEAGSPGGAATLPRDLEDRLERLEASVGAVPVTLRGTTGEPVAAATDAAASDPLRQMAEKVSALEARVVAAEEKAAAEEASRRPRAPRKRVSLSDAATELGLSRSEEADLRQIYQDTWDKAIALLAEPDGDAAAIRKELEDAARVPGAGRAVGLKYAPKFLSKMGEFFALEGERQTRVQEAVGAEKAEKLEAMDLIERDPLGFGASMRVETRTR